MDVLASGSSVLFAVISEPSSSYAGSDEPDSSSDSMKVLRQLLRGVMGYHVSQITDHSITRSVCSMKVVQAAVALTT